MKLFCCYCFVISERFLINVSKGGPSDSPPRRRDSTTPVQHYCIFTVCFKNTNCFYDNLSLLLSLSH